MRDSQLVGSIGQKMGITNFEELSHKGSNPF